MKRGILLSLILSTIFLVTLAGCTYTQADLDSAYEKGYEEGYDQYNYEQYYEGYDAGYSESKIIEYDRGYENGSMAGYDVGFQEGYRSAPLETTYSDGYNKGWREGRDEGYNSGYDFGYENGEHFGYDKGFDAGIAQGNDISYQKGYQAGLEYGNFDWEAADFSLEIVSVTSPVSPTDYATLKANTIPNAACYIGVFYDSGRSEAEDLHPKFADNQGNVSWTWKVGTETTLGRWEIVVIAYSLGDWEYGVSSTLETVYFEVK